MTTTDRPAGAILLRRLRESRGWSWSDLARALRDAAHQLAMTSLARRQVASIQRTVARWESLTDRTGPGDQYQVLLAHVYAHSPSGNLALGSGSDFGALLDALRHFGTPPQRVRQLRELITYSATRDGREFPPPASPTAPAGLAGAPRGRAPLDHELLDRLAEAVAAINVQIGSTPFIRLRLLLAPIAATCRRLLTVEHPGQCDKLMLLATNGYVLMARLAFETRDDETATSWYIEATDVARHLADRGHVATVQTSHAMVTLHATNDLDAAGAIAHAATVAAHRGAGYATRARAHAVHAEICARAGQTNEAAAALDRAWRSVDQTAVDAPRGGFSADRLRGFEGLCALYAGDAQRANDRLGRSLATLKHSRDAVQRGIVSTDLALARLRLGDPAACVELIHEAVDITATTGGRVSAQRIRHVRRALRPWRAESFLADLDDHIHETLLGR